MNDLKQTELVDRLSYLIGYCCNLDGLKTMFHPESTIYRTIEILQTELIAIIELTSTELKG